MSRASLAFVKLLVFVALCACGTENPCPDGDVPLDASCPGALRAGDDHSDLVAFATPVTPEVLIAAALDIETDVDLFSFAVAAGRNYGFRCTGKGSTYSPDFFISLLDDSGDIPYAGASARFSSYFVSTHATHDGTMYARLQFYSGKSAIQSGIECFLYDLGPDDHAGMPAAATVVATGTTVPGRIELDTDVDMFALDTVAGRSYRLKCTANDMVCALRLYDPQGVVLQDVRWGRESVTTLDFTAEQSGRYTVGVSYPDTLLDDGVGTYTYEPIDVGP
ncbi:hypothetical protein ACLESO_41050 [Pyxidicoccus sp. 3LG]